MKPTILVYYENDAESAMRLARTLRTPEHSALVRAARLNNGEEREECIKVLVMPDVTKHNRTELHRLFGNKVEYVTETTSQETEITHEEPERPRKRRVVTA